MRMIRVAGATHLFNPPKNWNSELYGECHPIEARMHVDTERGGLVTTTVAWVPTPEEARRLAAGGVLELTICSNELPPHRMAVVEAIEPAEVPHGSPAISINEEAHGFDDFGPAYP